MKKMLLCAVSLFGLQYAVTLLGQDLDYYGMCRGLCEIAKCPKSELYDTRCADAEVVKKCDESCARLKDPGYWAKNKERLEKAFDELMGVPAPTTPQKK